MDMTPITVTFIVYKICIILSTIRPVSNKKQIRIKYFGAKKSDRDKCSYIFVIIPHRQRELKRC